jgi:hypothetical protein
VRAYRLPWRLLVQSFSVNGSPMSMGSLCRPRLAMLVSLACAALTLFAAAPTLADGSNAQATIQWVHVHRDGTGYIQFDSDVSTAACSTKDNRMAFVVGTPGGNAILATATAAKLASRSVWIGGSGACDVPLNETMETLAWITLM